MAGKALSRKTASAGPGGLDLAGATDAELKLLWQFLCGHGWNPRTDGWALRELRKKVAVAALKRKICTRTQRDKAAGDSI